MIELNKIYHGDAVEVLKTFPDQSAHCCITSPPYFGLRDYQVEGQLGLEKTPEEYVARMVEVCREVKRVLRDDGTFWLNIGDSYASGKGTCFNPGGGANSLGKDRKEVGAHPLDRGNKSTLSQSGLKPKDLIGIPWMLAFALRADGWYLRSDIIWSKKNCMPESVSGSAWEHHRIKVHGSKRGTEASRIGGNPAKPQSDHNGRDFSSSEYIDCPGCDKCSPNDGYVLHMNAGRCTKSHEYVFLLTKSESYFYDSEAIKEPVSDVSLKRAEYGWNCDRESTKNASMGGNGIHTDKMGERFASPNGRNKRSVWNVATSPFREAHFATFNEELITPMILAGTSEKGVCGECGAPWVRVIKTSGGRDWHNDKMKDKGIPGQIFGNGGNKRGQSESPLNDIQLHQTLGWQATCKCHADVVPAIVLDPFMGTGTTGVVAKKNHRDFVGIELNEKYVAMANKRVNNVNAVLF